MIRRSLLSVSLALVGLLAGCGEPPKLVPPSMELSGTTLAFSATTGGLPPAVQHIEITNPGGGRLSAPGVQVSYQQGSGWLTTASVSGGPDVFSLDVQPSPGSLVAGTYVATVRVSSVSAVNSPLSVTVTFQVADGLVVTRQLSAWGEDGSAASAPATDVTRVTVVDSGGAGSTVLDKTAEGTWRGAAPVGAWTAEVLWDDDHRSFIQGSGLSLDLGQDLGGRAGRVAPTGATMVVPVVTGLQPWDPINDQLVYYAWGAQALAALATSSPADFPLFGDEVALDGTSLTYAFDWRPADLLAPADVLHAAQYRNVQKLLGPNLLDYQRAVAAASLTGLTQVDKTDLTLPEAALTSLLDVNDATVALSWQRLAFQAAIPPYASSLAFTGHHLGVYATPAPLTGTAPLAATALPLLACTDPGQMPPDFNAGAIGYARLQPAAWREFVLTRFASAVARRAPGATSDLPKIANIVYRYDAAASAPATFVPLVGGPTLPTIDGQDALAGALIAGVSQTPTLAWQPPATGTPTSYRVEVMKLSASGTASVTTPVADFVVGAGTTSLALPADVLAPSTTYIATIAARSSPTDAGGATPFRAGMPFGEARLWTVPFTTVP